ncbi:MAG: UDP-N-acetylmuramoyl-L-alanine--D-glutamate ligase [Rikenellaceae bacterium]
MDNVQKKRRVVVLGGGISGYGSALLAQREGFDTFLSDRGTIAPRYREELERHGIQFEEGKHTEELILSADEVVKSPGIPDKAPIIKELREAGIPVISEIEFAGRYLGDAKTICITGSNGKTTTTSLIYKILTDAGYSVALGGNIGESFACSVMSGCYDWYVLEISSFQLDGMYDFKADISVLMNITPDHLDRYDYNFQNYVDSKMRIIRNQTMSENFIFSGDDAAVQGVLKAMTLETNPLPFYAVGESQPQQGAYLREDDMVVASLAHNSVEVDTKAMKIKGLHNAYNAMAAALAALSAGVEPQVIEASIVEFDPVEHRLEPAGSVAGVTYINDSKATNVDSVWYALESMRQPTVWIAGGTDKGNDYTPLKEFARAKVHTLVCMGLDNEALQREFKGVIPKIISTASLEEAMSAARLSARAGDVVLLSPACASFDLFKNYEDRGRQFKEWVAKQNS